MLNKETFCHFYGLKFLLDFLPEGVTENQINFTVKEGLLTYKFYVNCFQINVFLEKHSIFGVYLSETDEIQLDNTGKLYSWFQNKLSFTKVEKGVISYTDFIEELKILTALEERGILDEVIALPPYINTALLRNLSSTKNC